MTAALILAAGPASVGQAQQPAGAAAAVLEEIVVTARRREESLQEVPVAVTALSSADLELRNIDNVQNLDALLPNVVDPRRWDDRRLGRAVRGSWYSRRCPIL